MSKHERSPAQSHATAWTVVILLTMILYVVTWPIVEIKTRLSSMSVIGGLTIPRLQKSPEWLLVLYRPLHAIRMSNGRKNLLADYWAYWNDRLVMQRMKASVVELENYTKKLNQQTAQRMAELERRREETKRIFNQKPSP
jgi:hypothetical protein